MPAFKRVLRESGFGNDGFLCIRRLFPPEQTRDQNQPPLSLYPFFD